MKKRLFRLFSILMVVALAGTGCIFGGDDGDPGDNPPPAPEVTGTSPNNGDDLVEVWQSITVIFSMPMDTASVRAAASFDTPTRATVPVEINWMGNMAIFSPYEDLDNNTLYILTIGTGATSAAGAALESEFTLSFTTEPTWPMVVATLPDDGDVDVARNAYVWIEFSTGMNEGSVTSAISIEPSVAWDIDSDWNEFTITFGADLAPNTLYTVTIDETAQADWGGETLPADYVFSFTTGTDVDMEPPYIVSTYPADGATGVPTSPGELLIEFSERIIEDSLEPSEMDPRLLMAVMMVGGPDSEPEFYWTGNTLHIPTLDLPAGSEFNIDFGPFYDLAGNESADPDAWTFSTAGSPEWFPSTDGDWWVYVRFGTDPEPWDEPFLNRVENVSGNDFDLARYTPDYGPGGRIGERDIFDEFTNLDELWHYSRNSGAIELNSISHWEDTLWMEQSFSPAVDWLQLPPTVGHTWNGVVDMTMDTETARVTYSGEVLAIEDVWWGMGWDALRGPDDGPPTGYFHGCVKVDLYHLVEVYIEGAWETMDEGTETIWYCPGVGRVKSHEENTNYDEGFPEHHVSDTEIYMWWTTN